VYNASVQRKPRLFFYKINPKNPNGHCPILNVYCGGIKQEFACNRQQCACIRQECTCIKQEDAALGKSALALNARVALVL